MKRPAALAIAALFFFFAIPLFSEAQNKKDTITKTDLFQVKSAEVFYNDEGVFIHFSFFQPADIYKVDIPSDMLKIIVSSWMPANGGTYLELTYDKTISTGLWGDLIKPNKATIMGISRNGEQKWLDKIREASQQYKKLRTKEVIPTIKK